MKKYYKLIYIGLLVVIAAACSSSEDTEPKPLPEPEPEPSVMDAFPEQITVQASDVKEFEYQYDFDSFLGIGRTDMLWIKFGYQGRDYLVLTETPPSYDSAKKVNTITYIDNPAIFDESKPAVLDSLIHSDHGLWGVIVREFAPFTVTIDMLDETNHELPGKLKKATFHIDERVEFQVVINGHGVDRKWYASHYLKDSKFFGLFMNERMQSFTKAPRHSVTHEFQ